MLCSLVTLQTNSHLSGICSFQCVLSFPFYDQPRQHFPLALISYDYFLTFHKEISRMWRPRKKTLVFYLFMTLRYATLFYQMTFSMSFFLPIWSVMVGPPLYARLFVLNKYFEGVGVDSIPCASCIAHIFGRCKSIIYVEQVCFIFSSSALSGMYPGLLVTHSDSTHGA